MDKSLINDMELCYKQIKEARDSIAEIKFAMNVRKPQLWEEATGTVDAKKDYIKSQLADEIKEISLLESEIEWYNNQIELLTWKMMSDE